MGQIWFVSNVTDKPNSHNNETSNNLDAWFFNGENTTIGVFNEETKNGTTTMMMTAVFCRCSHILMNGKTYQASWRPPPMWTRAHGKKQGRGFGIAKLVENREMLRQFLQSYLGFVSSSQRAKECEKQWHTVIIVHERTTKPSVEVMVKLVHSKISTVKWADKTTKAAGGSYSLFWFFCRPSGTANVHAIKGTMCKRGERVMQSKSLL